MRKTPIFATRMQCVSGFVWGSPNKFVGECFKYLNNPRIKMCSRKFLRVKQFDFMCFCVGNIYYGVLKKLGSGKSVVYMRFLETTKQLY